MLNPCETAKLLLSVHVSTLLWFKHYPVVHTPTHRQRETHASFFAHVCMCVPFITLELRSAGSYSTCQDWSPVPSQLLCFVPWRIQHLSWIFTGRERKSCMSTIYTGEPQMLHLQTLPVFKVYYSILPQCRNQQQKQILSNHLLMHRSDKAAVYLNGKTCHKAFKWN